MAGKVIPIAQGTKEEKEAFEQEMLEKLKKEIEAKEDAKTASS